MRATLSGLLLAALIPALLIGLLVLPAVPSSVRDAYAVGSSADHRKCVTVREYRQVHVGQRARRAVRILDGYGLQGDLGRVYRMCRGGHAIIAFAGAPAIVTLKYRLAPGADPWGRAVPRFGFLLNPLLGLP
jgi:hypothetical protein